jgi:hypothetical protein
MAARSTQDRPIRSQDHRFLYKERKIMITFLIGYAVGVISQTLVIAFMFARRKPVKYFPRPDEGDAL